MNDVHQALFDAKHANEPPHVLDDILAQCPDAECWECGRIICPYGEPMHFHHDGCPVCAEHDS